MMMDFNMAMDQPVFDLDLLIKDDYQNNSKLGMLDLE